MEGEVRNSDYREIEDDYVPPFRWNAEARFWSSGELETHSSQPYQEPIFRKIVDRLVWCRVGVYANTSSDMKDICRVFVETQF